MVGEENAIIFYWIQLSGRMIRGGDSRVDGVVNSPRGFQPTLGLSFKTGGGREGWVTVRVYLGFGKKEEKEMGGARGRGDID